MLANNKYVRRSRSATQSRVMTGGGSYQPGWMKLQGSSKAVRNTNSHPSETSRARLFRKVAAWCQPWSSASPCPGPRAPHLWYRDKEVTCVWQASQRANCFAINIYIYWGGHFHTFILIRLATKIQRRPTCRTFPLWSLRTSCWSLSVMFRTWIACVKLHLSDLPLWVYSLP